MSGSPVRFCRSLSGVLLHSCLDSTVEGSKERAEGHARHPRHTLRGDAVPSSIVAVRVTIPLLVAVRSINHFPIVIAYGLSRRIFCPFFHPFFSKRVLPFLIPHPFPRCCSCFSFAVLFPFFSFVPAPLLVSLSVFVSFSP